MQMVLGEILITEKLTRPGTTENIPMVAGEKLQIRYGNIANPTILLLETVPAGKKWDLRISIYIEETDM